MVGVRYTAILSINLFMTSHIYHTERYTSHWTSTPGQMSGMRRFIRKTSLSTTVPNATELLQPNDGEITLKQAQGKHASEG